MPAKPESRVRMTAEGAVRLTPTEVAIMNLVSRRHGRPCSKAEIAAHLNRNEKTVDRLVSHLRRLGVLESTPMFGENGGQLANSYRVVSYK